jgi:aldose 1-epimerase
MTAVRPQPAGRHLRPATGHQYELRRGAARAVIGQVAAVLREFSVDGVHYTETWPDAQTPPMGCGMVLMPWPNRVAGGRWRHQGVDLQLDITEPGRGNAIHGLLRNTAYQPVSGGDGASGSDTVTLAAPIYPQHGWPFTLDTAVTYALTGDGLRVTHTVTNVGAEPAPFGCGAHPYLRIGGVPTEDLTLTVRAGRQIRTDERMIPTGTGELDGALAGLPTGVRLGDLDVDTGLADLQSVGGRYEHTLTGPQGRGLTLWADPAFGWVQLYTPHDFPAPEGKRQAVAVEPMTCPADALNSGDGLILLAPGETWRASWGITPSEG